MCSESEEKYGDEVASNRIINLKFYTTDIDKFLLWFSCAQEEALQIKIKE